MPSTHKSTGKTNLFMLGKTNLFMLGGQHEVGGALVGGEDAERVVGDGRVVRVRLRVARSVHLLDLRVPQVNLQDKGSVQPL